MTSHAHCTTEMHLNLPDSSASETLGRHLAGLLRRGDTLLLSGPIGAGKSHLARAIIRELLRRNQLPPEDIPSPTYTLVQTYELGADEVWHADLYRLSGPDEVIELGLDAAFENAICLVEWPDRLAELSPPDALRIELAEDPANLGRNARIFAPNARWKAPNALIPAALRDSE